MIGCTLMVALAQSAHPNFIQTGGVGMVVLHNSLFLIVVMASFPAFAQFPDKFTNLQVLPKDIAKHDLEQTMRGFAFALGVRCNHCHVQQPDKAMNFASDDKQTKKTARIMLQMVANINQNYISQVQGTGVRVECGTCHRGLTTPRPLQAVLGEKIDKEGIEAGVSLYNELRSRYYGGGQYDFGETPLNQLSEQLLAKNKNREAVTVMELNFKANHPDSVWAYHILAMAHQANGQLKEAITDYKNALVQHPDDTWAKSQVDELSKKLGN